MNKEFSLEELANRLTSNADESFEGKRLIRKTLASALPDVTRPDNTKKVAYNGLAESYDWRLEPGNGPQHVNVAYEPDPELADLGLLYLGSPGNSFAHVIQPSKTRYENGALWLHHLRQGQEMDVRLTYSDD